MFSYVASGSLDVGKQYRFQCSVNLQEYFVMAQFGFPCLTYCRKHRTPTSVCIKPMMPNEITFHHFTGILEGTGFFLSYPHKIHISWKSLVFLMSIIQCSAPGGETLTLVQVHARCWSLFLGDQQLDPHWKPTNSAVACDVRLIKQTRGFL